MLDFDAGKLLIIGLVALVVIGPKDLPRVLRQVGQAVTKLRRMAGEFQGQFMDAMKEADLQDIKAELAKIKDSATLDVDFDPARDIKTHITGALGDQPAAKPVVESGAVETVGVESAASGFALPPATEGGTETTLARGPMADAETTPLAEVESPSMTMPDHAVDTSGSESLPAGFQNTLSSSPDPYPEALDGAMGMLAPPAEAGPPAEASRSTPRRKIVVTRRRRLSRLDGPTVRAALLAGHSRNIRPARRDTTDP